MSSIEEKEREGGGKKRGVPNPELPMDTKNTKKKNEGRENKRGKKENL